MKKRIILSIKSSSDVDVNSSRNFATVSNDFEVFRRKGFSKRAVPVFLAAVLNYDPNHGSQKIRVPEFLKFIGYSNHHDLSMVEKAVEDALLLGGRVSRTADKTIYEDIYFNWFEDVRVISEEKKGERTAANSYVVFRFGEEARHILKDRSNGYVKVLSDARKIRNHHIILLYLFLRRFDFYSKYRKSLTVSLEDLRRTLCLQEGDRRTKKEYPDFSDVETKILKKSQQKLKEELGFVFYYKKIKSGREIKGVEFWFHDNRRISTKK